METGVDDRSSIFGEDLVQVMEKTPSQVKQGHPSKVQTRNHPRYRHRTKGIGRVGPRRYTILYYLWYRIP